MMTSITVRLLAVRKVPKLKRWVEIVRSFLSALKR